MVDDNLDDMVITLPSRPQIIFMQNFDFTQSTKSTRKVLFFREWKVIIKNYPALISLRKEIIDSSCSGQCCHKPEKPGKPISLYFIYYTWFIQVMEKSGSLKILKF